MARFRSILAFVLVIITTLLVSCGGPTSTAKGPLYTSAQLEQIQHYTDEVQAFQAQMQALPPLIQQGEWNDVISFIHGPLGELRATMSRLSRSLTPKAQPEALKAAREVFEHLNGIDEAAQVRDVTKALRNYNDALRDFETFFQLVPS